MTEDEIILTHVLQCSRSDLYLRKPQLTVQQQNQIKGIRDRLGQGEPLQYILGECEFFGLPFKVDARVLIPRPETELLVETVVKYLRSLKDVKEQLSVLDIGTGSGNIPVSLVKHCPGIRAVSIDLSKEALDLARDNASQNAVQSEIEFIHADVFTWLGEQNPFHQFFSVVVSNPPYVTTDEMVKLPKDVKREPAAALHGGKDGLSFFGHIISNVGYVLKPGGWLFFEIGDPQGKSLENLLTRQGSFVNIATIQDFNQRDRIVKAQLKT